MMFILIGMQTCCSYGDLIQLEEFSNTVRGPVCLRRKLLTVYFLKPFSGLRFDFYTFFPPPTAAAGAWSRDMEADIVECDKLEESEDTSQGSGPVPNRFLSSLLTYLFKDLFFYSCCNSLEVSGI